MPQLCVFVIVSKLQPSQPLLRIYTGDKAVWDLSDKVTIYEKDFAKPRRYYTLYKFNP